MLVLILVNIIAVNCPLLKLSEVVDSLPEELIVPDVTYKVALKEDSKAVNSVLWSVDIHILIALILTCSDLLVVKVGHITVKAIEVHSLIVIEGQ